jgi:hypothetical protein
VRLRNRNCTVVPTGNAVTVVFVLVVEAISVHVFPLSTLISQS